MSAGTRAAGGMDLGGWSEGVYVRDRGGGYSSWSRNCVRGWLFMAVNRQTISSRSCYAADVCAWLRLLHELLLLWWWFPLTAGLVVRLITSWRQLVVVAAPLLCVWCEQAHTHRRLLQKQKHGARVMSHES